MMIKKRKTPMRICIGCRLQKPKKELIRIVRTPDSQVLIDLTGKRSGRGAYICAAGECLELSAKGKRLEKNLQHPISADLYAELRVMFNNLS